jgi:precorrin-2/cobalt-factor-2 C20-methyltransferase
MTSGTRAKGILYGVGLGPGDPDLVTLKAARIVSHARVVAHFRKKGRAGHARSIAKDLIPAAAIECAFEYPVTTEVAFDDESYVSNIRDFYEASAAEICKHLDNGSDVALLCEGDPFFYGSFLHMYDRIKGSYPTVVVPGITGMSGCWTAAGAPITYGDDVLSVLPGTLNEAALEANLRGADAAVIMKVGTNLEKIRRAVLAAGRMNDAIYVERGSMTGEKVMPLSTLAADAAPYFSIVLIPGGRGRRIV